MAKDTYYFSHDYNARNDRKIAALVRDYKSSGYGIFWATCEMMHEEGGELEFDNITVGSIAKDLNELPEFITEVLEKCISDYRLFTKQNEAERSTNILLRSGRIDRNLVTKKDKKEAKAKSGRLGGIKSGESRRNKDIGEAKRSTASSNEANEIKVNEIKVIKENINNTVSTKNTITNTNTGEKKTFNTKPLCSDFNGLPEQYVTTSIELVRSTGQQLISKNVVLSMWEIFKTVELTGDTYYPNEGKVYSHFTYWIKKQKLNANDTNKAKIGSVGKTIEFDKP